VSHEKFIKLVKNSLGYFGAAFTSTMAFKKNSQATTKMWCSQELVYTWLHP